MLMSKLRVVACVLVFSLILAVAETPSVYAGSGRADSDYSGSGHAGSVDSGSGHADMDVSQRALPDGVACVKIDVQTKNRLRIGVHAIGCDRRYYFAVGADEHELDIPLMFGNDSYALDLYEELEDNNYKLVASRRVDVNLDDYSEAYLASSVMAPWGDSAAATSIAAKVTQGKRGDFAIFLAIYKYVTENIVYDITKETGSGYRSAPDETVESGYGICLDFAVLLATMLRYSGVKCKLVFGRAKDTNADALHSWNEVYLWGRWVVVDPTRDAISYVNRSAYKFNKPSKDYVGDITF